MCAMSGPRLAASGARAATGSFLAPAAVFVSVVAALLTPVLLSRSTEVANLVDARLPRSLQTYATLYGSWVESARSASASKTPAARIRRLARIIVFDTILLATILIGASLALRTGTALLAAWLGLPEVTVQGGALLLALAALFPLLYAIVRAARSLGDRKSVV